VVAFLLLGFVVGVRHALEVDHVAAVASLATRGGSLRSQAAQGASARRRVRLHAALGALAGIASLALGASRIWTFAIASHS
jgi:hypothetical protein